MTTTRQGNEAQANQEGTLDYSGSSTEQRSTASTAGSTDVVSLGSSSSLMKAPVHEQMQERQKVDSKKHKALAVEPLDRDVDQRIADYVAKALQKECQTELQQPSTLKDEDINSKQDFQSPCYEPCCIRCCGERYCDVWGYFVLRR